MQLILDSEPALDIKRDMSAVEDIHTEKVGNGDIEKRVEKNSNRNKENIGEVNVFSIDEKNKQVINRETEASPNLSTEIKSENTKDDSSCESAIIETTRDVDIPEANGTINEEESQQNGNDEEIRCTSTSPITNELEEKSNDTVQEAIVENAGEIIGLERENLDQIPDITENKSEEVIPEDEKTPEEDSQGATDDVEIIEEPTVTLEICDSPLNEEMQEPDAQEEQEAASTIENGDKPLESNKDKSESSEDEEKPLDESKNETEVPADSTEVNSSDGSRDPSPIEFKDDMDVEEIVEPAKSKEKDTVSQPKEKPSAPVSTIDKPVLCKLSNTLDILSDDEDEPPKEEPSKPVDLNEKKSIYLEDDDEIMLIDDETTKTETPPVNIEKEDTPMNTEDKADLETGEKAVEGTINLFTNTDEKAFPDSTSPEKDTNSINISDKEDTPFEPVTSDLPLLQDNFLKSAKKNIADMTREDLEEFCVLKIVESIVDRSNLSEIKNKLKTVTLNMEEYRKKTMTLTKQNRDLQVVMKSIQEEQKKNLAGVPITPLKITRSVGMQVYMEKTGPRRKNLAQLQNYPNTRPKSFPNTNLRPHKPTSSTQSIPVPRLVPANSVSPMKSPSTIPMVNQIVPGKIVQPVPNGIKNPSPSQKMAEKRTRNRTMSVTVDLTDDEPPAKVNNRTSPAPPVRLVPSQSLMANPRQAYPAGVTNPRKVYIPIGGPGPQNQNIRPGQTIMLKTVPTPGLRPKIPNTQVGRPTSVRLNRHPAPLPDAMKQYQPPNWKALPPAPELKLSKVENGIVISWKIEGYQEDSYEEIASYQLYAYQETSSPPSTALWKKIGDVKALPLPMACTLTQFMAGFKYFFAVRAVDIRSRLGPFSLPGSILLLNKL